MKKKIQAIIETATCKHNKLVILQTTNPNHTYC